MTALAQKNRDRSIDTLRGIACILLVALHVIGENPTQGLRIEETHPLAIFTHLAFHLRMPLFAMLSGFVYAWRPAERGRMSSFWVGKGRRLVLPFLFAATAFAGINTVLGGGFAMPWGDFWQVYVFAYAHFWFIQAVLLIFVAYAVADWLFPNRPHAVALGMMILSIGLFVSPLAPDIEFLSITRAVYLFPFFALGVFMCRFDPKRFGPAAQVWAAVAVLLFVLHTMNSIADPHQVIERRAVFSLMAGLAFAGALLANRFSFLPLAWIGQYSYSIYLYHLFAVMGTQMVYNFTGEPAPWPGIAIGLAAGLLAPIGVELFTMRYLGWAAPFVIGLKGKSRQRGETSRVAPANAAV
ncbi:MULTISPECIES: acyltransferase family protein [Hyphobacterium]|uniref:Acyltransferase family protein n=1 Tax=Hyphobacterium vulgare TaxID=1736751 RepID=A0ABV6ZUW9_9PROT